MTNLAKIFTGLLFYAYVGIHQVRRLVFDNYQTCTFPFSNCLFYCFFNALRGFCIRRFTNVLLLLLLFNKTITVLKHKTYLQSFFLIIYTRTHTQISKFVVLGFWTQYSDIRTHSTQTIVLHVIFNGPSTPTWVLLVHPSTHKYLILDWEVLDDSTSFHQVISTTSSDKKFLGYDRM